MSQRVGEKRSRSSGRISDTNAPPRKQSRVEEDDSDDGDELTQDDFSFSQAQVQSQDEQEAVRHTKELRMVSEVDPSARRDVA